MLASSVKGRHMVAAWVLFAAITALPADPLIQGRSVAPDNEPKAENIDRQPVAEARGRDVETRRDEDGRLYTRQEFLAVYNDTEEWETAGRHERRKRNRYGNARGSNRRSVVPKETTVGRLQQQARSAGDREVRKDRKDYENLAARARVPPVAPGTYRPGDPFHRASNRPQRPLVENR